MMPRLPDLSVTLTTQGGPIFLKAAMASLREYIFSKAAVGIKVGGAADLCVYDLNAKYTVDPKNFLSMGRSTPFEGWEVYGIFTK